MACERWWQSLHSERFLQLPPMKKAQGVHFWPLPASAVMWTKVPMLGKSIDQWLSFWPKAPATILAARDPFLLLPLLRFFSSSLALGLEVSRLSYELLALDSGPGFRLKLDCREEELSHDEV
eukprot:CAMPEP_0176089382 /NCGR_PEP_ID=MMETSP0120_2-20121206/44764_1 /TAXON_ID=160619 /ORGANISM="Kryptoperidinium foliaceum, Strain CCMP 1326" /LENGTH=121 /DNA_ID=CAMNT_0017423261 /DNA_START=93 /DNA_END=458 /DNA_ORIENTATION=+